MSKPNRLSILSAEYMFRVLARKLYADSKEYTPQMCKEGKDKFIIACDYELENSNLIIDFISEDRSFLIGMIAKVNRTNNAEGMDSLYKEMMGYIEKRFPK